MSGESPNFFSYAVFIGLASLQLLLTSDYVISLNRRRNTKEKDNINKDEIYKSRRSSNRLSFDYIDRNRGRQRHLTFHRHFEKESESTHESVKDNSLTSDILRKSGYKCWNELISLKKDTADIEDFCGFDQRFHQGTSLSFTSSVEDYGGDDLSSSYRIRCNLDDSDEDGDVMDVDTVTSNHDIANLEWRKRIMPNRLVMLRHGESEGNVNEDIYATKADSDICLTKLGWEEAKIVGKALKDEIFGDPSNKTNQRVHFIVSPYVRTIETFHGIASAWCDPDLEFGHIASMEERKILWYDRLASLGVTWHEDPRIREQDWGNYQNPEDMKIAKKERHNFGVFYYRFPNGESVSDVYDRVSTFLDSLWRSFDTKKCQNYVLVTHGISIRAILSRYFRYSIDQFNLLANPKNCEAIILGHDGSGKLQLEGRCEVLHESNNEEVVASGYEFHQKLRIVQKRYMRTRSIRISYQNST